MKFWIYKQIVRIGKYTGLTKQGWVYRFNSYIRSKLRPDFIITKKYGFKMYLDKLDSLHLSVYREWEIEEVEYIERNVKEGDVALDIGANIGYFTLILSELVGKDGRVYAFECDPDNFKLLERNIKENNCNNVILINKAVSDINGREDFYIKEGNTAGNSLRRVGDRSIVVDSIRLDDYFIDGKIDFIKIDIEGAEIVAIRGMKKLLLRNKIKLLTEYCFDKDNISEELNNLGFAIKEINDTNLWCVK